MLNSHYQLIKEHILKRNGIVKMLKEKLKIYQLFQKKNLNLTKVTIDDV
jgi:hypothetical protein